MDEAVTVFTHVCTVRNIDGERVTVGMVRPGATAVELAAECATAMIGHIPVYGEILGCPGRATVIPASSIAAITFEAYQPDPDMLDLAATVTGVGAGAQ